MSLIRITSLILKQLNKQRILSYDELLKYLIQKEGEDIRYVFLPALSFLYLLGKIEYHLKTDSIEVIT